MRRVARLVGFAGVFMVLPVLLLAPDQGLAQDVSTKTIDITGFVGWRWGGSAQIGEADFSIDASESFGGAVDLGIYETWEGIVILEAWFSQQRGTISVDSSSTTARTEAGKMDIRYYMGGIGYEWKLPKANPYFVFIMGATEFAPVDHPEHGDTRFTWGFAGGIKYKLGPQLGIRADVRGYGTETDLTETGWVCGYYTCGLASYDKTIWQGDASAGLYIAF